MEPIRIEGATRTIGESQGYIGLPLRDIVVNDSVTGPATPAMQSAWAATDAERAAIASGGALILTVMGKSHPPVMLEIGAAPDEDSTAHHNRMAGMIVRMLIGDGTDPSGIMVLTESVLVGVALATIRLGGDEAVLGLIFERARARLAELRLGDIKTEGRA